MLYLLSFVGGAGVGGTAVYLYAKSALAKLKQLETVASNVKKAL